MDGGLDNHRQKLLDQIDLIHSILRKMLGLSVGAVLIGMLWTSLARAASIPDIFLVPIVRLTPIGAAVLQPQTGDGYNMLFTRARVPYADTTTNVPLNNTTPVYEAGTTSNFTKSGTYIPPQIDPFSEQDRNATISVDRTPIRNIDTVDFVIRNDRPGSTDPNSGTTATTFSFTANISSNDYRQGEIEYRWDFENDGVVDSYFSTIKTITHRYDLPGEYQVKLEILDQNGVVTTALKPVIVVSNDAPKAFFKVNMVSAPKNSILRFDTSFSSDSQYAAKQLIYRFDWNGDGVFDTNYQNKTIWNHMFREMGSFPVLMEVQDPEGLTAKAEITIKIHDDTHPTARLSIERVSDFRYYFDGSYSTDDFTPLRKLQFRFDLDYTGRDDITFDSTWSVSPKFAGTYRLGGSKMVRMQVKDQQGLVSQAFVRIDVPWPEEYLNKTVGILNR